jgi:hypothetical protein
MGLGLNSNLPLKERLVGIEVEVERCYDSERAGMYWSKKHDSSLREGGAEWVSPPIPLDSAEESVATLYYDFCNYDWAANTRTGIHVHVDVRDLTAEELQAVAVVYCLAERAFCLFVGQEREENIYCVPWYRAPREAIAVMGALRELGEEPHTGAALLRETVKYAGLYFEPIQRFGTVEFRHAPTWTDREPVMEWVRMCYSAVEYAKQLGTPEQVLEAWEGSSPSAFAFAATGYTPPKDYDKWFENGASEGTALQMLERVNPTEEEMLQGSSCNFFTFDEFVTLSTDEMVEMMEEL